MLKQTLTSINNILDDLISLTKKDIADIKKARHESLFKRNKEKEILISEFTNLKSKIDSILVQRTQNGITLENMFNKEESNLFDEFKNKLQQFHKLHQKFAKMALIITNFYSNLLNKVTGSEIDIGYQMTKSNNSYSNFSLKA